MIKKTAILSYHLSPDELLTQVITHKKIEYRKTPIDKQFYDAIDSLKTSLHEPAANKFKGQANSNYLYKLLISPVLAELRSVNRLIIIPDDELHYLPFEALRDENDRYLLENFSIQYHYSTSLLFRTRTNKLDDQLAFAPFASASFKDSQGVSYNALPASTEEIKEIRGKIFLDTTATRKNFIDNAGKFGIIHLATHAQANNDQPNLSYIAFSPGKDRQDHRLYAEEIYTLDLDSSDLIILSACETGSGKLIKGEGLMSLSRAFAYAGCPNIITSLWKAEDRSTSYIARQLHRYLEKGLSKDKALQKAKLDLLKDDKLDPRYKSPNYWAHLVFIGDYEKNKRTSRWTWILGGLIIVLASVYFIKRSKIL